MKIKNKYVIMSPDGFTIHPTDEYSNKREAFAAFKAWKSRYKLQGFYSSVRYGRIPLEDLEGYCEVVNLK